MEVAPLPVKKAAVSARKKKEGLPSSELTSKETLSFVKEKGQKDSEQPEQTKKPRIRESQEVIGKNVVKYLGVGVTRLQIRPGKKGDRCLYCQLPYHEMDQGKPEDQWVQCKACKFPSHKHCMQNLIKCPCGAQAPKNK